MGRRWGGATRGQEHVSKTLGAVGPERSSADTVLVLAAHPQPTFSSAPVVSDSLLFSLSTLLILKETQALKEMELREVNALVQGHLVERLSQDGNPSWPHILRK